MLNSRSIKAYYIALLFNKRSTENVLIQQLLTWESKSQVIQKSNLRTKISPNDIVKVSDYRPSAHINKRIYDDLNYDSVRILALLALITIISTLHFHF